MLRAILFVFVLFFGNVFFAMSPVMGANVPGNPPAQQQNIPFPRQTEDVNIDELYQYEGNVSEYDVSTNRVIRPAIPLRFNNDINSVRNRVACREIRRGVYKLAQVNITGLANVIKITSERFLEKVEFSFNSPIQV